MLNEELTKSDIKKIKSIIKKEFNSMIKTDIEKFKEKDLKRSIKSFITTEYKDEMNDNIEDITKKVMQGFYDLLYKERHILKNKVKIK